MSCSLLNSGSMRLHDGHFQSEDIGGCFLRFDEMRKVMIG